MSQSERPPRRETALPCPICGKNPKIKVEDFQNVGAGCWVTIYCKKWYQKKPHLFIDVGKSTYERALKLAIEDWNKMVGGNTYGR